MAANLWNVSSSPAVGGADDGGESRRGSKAASELGSMLFNMALGGLAKQREDAGLVNAAGQATVLGQTSGHRRAALNWKKVARVVRKGSATSDCWQDLVADTTQRVATEMLYSVSTGKWTSKPVLVRINLERAVAQGAMRRCFRMKMVPLVSSSTLASSSSTSERTLAMCEWAALCESSVLDVVSQIGRRTLMRIRTQLGYKACSAHHPLILTVGELGRCAQTQGCEHVENIFKHECHGMGLEAFGTLRGLLQRAVRDERSWQRESLNRMAKQYMLSEKDVLETYEEDVIMQEIVKHVCDQYNALEPQPPKAVDMLHVGLLRIEGEGAGQAGAAAAGPTYLGYESFVTGEYRKWNTNAGWVDAEHVRHTPHAFSFASFRISKGELMVVDIQGVNDLYTDPQVHSLSRKGFGKGNLGATGMALFLRTFRYDLNPIAQYLGLAPFALLDGEQPAASAAEVDRFLSGKAYLESEEWEKRQETLASGRDLGSPRRFRDSFYFDDSAGGEQGSVGPQQSHQDEVQTDDSARYAAFARRGSNSSSHSSNSSSSSLGGGDGSGWAGFDADEDAGEDEDVYLEVRKLVSSEPAPVHELNMVPQFLLECKAKLQPLELPRPVMHRIPSAETPEASVHLALVQLYEQDGEDEEALALGEGCSVAQAVQFHLWMAALGGSLSAMERCALDDLLPNNSGGGVLDERSRRASRVNWLHSAALRGSRACAHRALDYVDPKDTLMCIFYLQRVLACPDGKTEAERKADFCVCDHEVHWRLSKAFGSIGEPQNALKHCQAAADLALQAGDYMSSMTYTEAVEALQS